MLRFGTPHAWRQRGGLPEGFFSSGETTESAAAITEASTEEVDQRWILVRYSYPSTPELLAHKVIPLVQSQLAEQLGSAVDEPPGHAGHTAGWHRLLVRWRWIHPPNGGRPPVDAKLVMLIEQMARKNPG